MSAGRLSKRQRWNDVSDKTKLALKRFALRIARRILWHLDEWVHTQELKLRDEPVPIARPVLVEYAKLADVDVDDSPEEIESTPAPKKPRARRRRGIPAAAFDLRFSQ